MGSFPDIPLGLRHALESGECVLFLGAGLGYYLVDEEGSVAPDGKKLAKELREHFSIDTESDNLSKMSEVVELRKGRSALERYLHKRLANLTPDQNIKWLVSRRWKAIFTTNYDQGLQRAYELVAEPPQQPVTISVNNNLTGFNAQVEVPIYHIHGTLFGVENPKILITENDYALYKEQRCMLFNILKTEFATSTFLYIGYSNQDPNWNILLGELKSEFYPTDIPFSYRIAPYTDPLDAEILKKRSNIESIDMDLESFVNVSKSLLKELDVDMVLAGRMRSMIPVDLMGAFEKNPAAMIRLFTSWEYVNASSFSEKPNVYDFLRGNKPNWSLVGAYQHFERDIEDEIFDDLLDYATQEKQKVDVKIILGSAGYGTSTLLMSLATKLVQERAGNVFMLKPGASVIEGDVEFATSLMNDTTFFFIDNATENAKKLKIATIHLRERGIPALFMLGARLNEWRQCNTKIPAQEFSLEHLSDAEISRLIDCLVKNSELGVLEHLDQEMRFAAIKRKYKKELLVVLREATEGESFDAILESEFRLIGNQLSQDLYLLVCCFYQHGAYVRDALLCKLLDISLAELHAETSSSIEGVVIWECIDESRGLYGARARHRKIAAIVWERCRDTTQQDYILQSIIKELNITYKTDKDAFEYFIKSDRMVDSISTPDNRIKFFELACRKDPDNPYVRQHFARMLSRAGNAELALGQIEKAVSSPSPNRIFYHTKGVILSQLAFEIDSLEIARRRLIQSESCFKKGIEIAPKDDYCYQGLARLYLNWAKKKTISSEETTDYIAKAEEVVSNGLRVVRIRDSLWIVSSDIQSLLGDNPAQLEALTKAVKASEGNIIASYLLGKSYRRAYRYSEAIEVFRPIMFEYPDEFRIAVEYALCLINLGKPYTDAIAVLNLSTLYGLSDPRFIATLGGTYLLNGDVEKALSIFAKARKRSFSASELNAIQFTPPDPNNLEKRFRLKGRVTVVKAGYSMIESDGYPQFLCPGSKFGRTLMTKGLRLNFSPAFSAKGALATNPVPIDS